MTAIKGQRDISVLILEYPHLPCVFSEIVTSLSLEGRKAQGRIVYANQGYCWKPPISTTQFLMGKFG
jgi:hypothetical protein